MATQNKKFTTVLLAGLFLGGAVALGYACGGDDSAPAVDIPKVDSGSPGAGGTANTGVGGGGGVANTGGNAGDVNAGGGGNAGAGTGGGDSGGPPPCQVSGTFDNAKAKTLFPTDGGVPAL